MLDVSDSPMHISVNDSSQTETSPHIDANSTYQQVPAAAPSTTILMDPEPAFRPRSGAALTRKTSQERRDGERKPEASAVQMRAPSISPEDVNHVNHLRGQFRFVDDAQRLFRPLLEAIGVNIKVRVRKINDYAQNPHHKNLLLPFLLGCSPKHADEEVWRSFRGRGDVGVLPD